MKEDHFYEYWPIIDRPQMEWPGGKRLAVYVGLNIEHYESGKPSVGILDKAAGRDPDPLNEGWRDYGNRVGVWRIMEMLDTYHIRPSVLLNADACINYPRIIEEGNRRSWNWVAHGKNNSMFTGREQPQMSREAERLYLNDVLSTINRMTGKTCKGWLGPLGLSETYNTLDLLAEEGITYVLDWINDEQPYPLKTYRGEIISVPYSLEINDLPLFLQKGMTGPEFGQMIIDQFEVLRRDAVKAARVMAICIHPFVVGQPFRHKYLEQAIAYISKAEDVWIATCDEIAAWYMLNYYDDHVQKLREIETVHALD